jgi:hypothetical protein
MMPVISIKLRMGGSRQQRQGAVDAILALMAERLKVKGKIHIKAPGNTPGVPSDGTNNVNTGQDNNDSAPDNTTATNSTTAPTSSSKIGKNNANGQGSSENGKNSGDHGRSTISNVQGTSNEPGSFSEPDGGSSNIGCLESSSSPSRILQGTVRMALEEQGRLCLEDDEQEDTDIDLENYAEEDKVQSIIFGIRNGSIPLVLADNTQVRDTVCQANTTLSMVAIPLVPLDEPADSSDETVAEEGWRLSTNYVIMISVLGGAVFLLVVFLFFRRRSARVTQI